MTTSRSFRSIYWKFLAIVIPVFTLIAVIFESIYIYTKNVSDERQLITKVETISSVYTLAVSYPLWSLELDELNRILETIVLHPEIVCVEVGSVNSEEQYQWPEDCVVGGSKEKIVSSKLFYNNQNVGRMDLYFTTVLQREALKHQTWAGILYYFLQIVGAGLAAYLALHYTVGRPVSRLITAIKRADQRNAMETVDWSSRDELGVAISAYNNLVKQVQENTLELITTQRQLETAAHTKNRFLANMSHELRTPLNTVIGITEMLKEEAEEQHNDTEPYDRVTMSGRHLLQLIDDLLDMSTLDAGKISISEEVTDLESLLKQVCATVQPMATSQNNKVELKYSNRPEFIDTDPLRLKQILINLLSNACKFTRNGDIQLEVTERYVAGVMSAHFCVRDTGIGIPENQHDQLFSEFFQVDASTVRQYGGAGLGLNISQRLCELLGGEISINSTVGQGSEFSFSLSVQSQP